MTDDRRPRPSSGVMGFVAQYQRVDPEATYVQPGAGRHEAPPPWYPAPPDQRTVYTDEYEIRSDRPGSAWGDPHQPEYPDYYGTYPDQYQADPGSYPPADDATAVFAGPGERLIDLSAPRQAPVEHRRPGRMRKGVLALAALAVMLAGGTGYVLLRGTGSDKSAAASVRKSVEASAPPSASTGDSTVPNGEPVHTAPATPARTSAAATHRPTVIALIPVPVATRPVRTVAPVKPSAPTSAPTPTASAGPPSVAPLSAAYGYRTDGDDADPITGYLGTIHVANPGDTAAAAWAVQLTVPSGNTVTIETGDVTTSRDGGSVTFRPAGPIAAHGSATFTFSLSDPLTILPTACTINGAACN